MKLTVALILFACLQVSAKTYSQDRVTLKFNAANIKKVLAAIEKKSNYRFLYSDALLADKPKVDIDVTNEEVTSVLDDILAHNGIAYKVFENNLVVLRATAPDNMTVEIPDIRVAGRVIDANGQPLPGVSVTIKGTQGGVVTDAGGNFVITVPNENAKLVFSYVGFDSQEVSVGSQTTINITLLASTKAMDQVVVIGYGTASKRDLTGSIAKVSGKEVADKPNTNPVASLQGKVSGLSVVNSATPGQQPDVRIRGTISIGSVKPLYVVDGIFNDNIDYINPEDIESIEVLKDPSSLAIFGVRGAAGVIAITTKRAKVGQVVVNFNANYGSKKMVDKIKMANGDQFRQLLALEGDNRFNDNGDVAIKNFIATQLPLWTGNTDWVDALTRTAHFTNDNLSVSASTDRNRLYLGVGYSYDEGLVKHVKYERISLTANDEFKINKALKIGFNVNVSREEFPYGGAVGQLAQAKRVAPVVPSGTQRVFTRDPYGADSADFDLYYAVPIIQNTLNNPLMELENNFNKTIDTRYRVVGSVFAEYSFLKYFSLKGTLYADIWNQDRRVYSPVYDGYNPEIPGVYPVTTLTGVSQDKEDTKRYQQDYILSFKKTFGDHGLSATAGFTTYYDGFFKLHGEAKQQSGSDPIPNDERFWYVSNGFVTETAQKASSTQKEAATVSTLFRALYNFKNKYYLNASVRRDGSSLIYNPDTRYQTFWAVGAAWELTRESFMDNQDIFNFLKLKASLGVLGNQNTYGTDYPYFPTISQGATAVFGNSVFPSYANNYLVSSDLKWETVHGKEIGLEFALLDNRLHGDMAYYHKETKDMLTFLRPPGLLPTLTNLGGLKNSGFEFSAGWDQVVSNDLTFTISANLTTYHNEVTRLDYPLPADEQFPNQTQVGFPIGYFYGYVVEGVYQSYAEKLASPVFTEFAYGPGDLKYKDVNGDGVVNSNDKTMIGNPTPDFTYGGSLNVNYKNFNLGIDVVGVYGNEIYRYWNTSENVFSVYNYPEYAINSWRGEGTSNWVPILNVTRKVNRLPSTFGIEDGSYFRIRNLQVGYNIPTKTVSKASIKSARVYINVQNLKTWKRNLGYSPEFAGGNINGQPATSFGIDIGDANSAIPRVFTAGINVTF